MCMDQGGFDPLVVNPALCIICKTCTKTTILLLITVHINTHRIFDYSFQICGQNMVDRCMVQTCSVPNCDSKLIKDNGIIFYRIPLHNSKSFERWSKALEIENWTPTENCVVCSKHFQKYSDQTSPSEVSFTDLLCGSVLNDSKRKICSMNNNKRKSNNLDHTNTKRLQKGIKKTIPITLNKNFEQGCFVQTCQAPKDLPLYRFPYNNKHLLHIWSKRIGLSTLYDLELYLDITICKNHFHEDCYDKNSLQLKPNAIPSINLIDYLGPPENCFSTTTNSEEISMMTSNGDHTWGWLGSTEQFGRISELNEFIEIPKSQLQDEKYACFAQAAHCFIYAENSKKVFNIYHPRATILMQLRYDGYFGFPGGLIDANEDIVNAVNREMAEEINLNTDLHSVTNDDHVISHWSEKKKLVLHFYKLKVTMAELIEIEKRALLAQDYGSEVLGTVRIPLYTLGDHYRGFPVFLKHNFIGCSREQLIAALSILNIMKPEEIKLALSANSINI
ncbi:uncharacterized protein LOC112679758 isoform X2 [Sipha flava]|uniref:U8 snoRNA-decapping enzyme n=1 Tax=Sipha flava TaxID=143950 RepID=A0A8B8F4A0_9HEMI|nr:uncharacterized protein LOC112679758 isoform X2 [Sipha flava]